MHFVVQRIATDPPLEAGRVRAGKLIRRPVVMGVVEEVQAGGGDFLSLMTMGNQAVIEVLVVASVRPDHLGVTIHRLELGFEEDTLPIDRGFSDRSSRAPIAGKEVLWPGSIVQKLSTGDAVGVAFDDDWLGGARNSGIVRVREDPLWLSLDAHYSHPIDREQIIQGLSVGLIHDQDFSQMRQAEPFG